MLTLSDGTIIFAPLAHMWLSTLEKISLSSRWTSECLICLPRGARFTYLLLSPCFQISIGYDCVESLCYFHVSNFAWSLRREEH